MEKHFFSDGQLACELEKCQFCTEKPCLEACPSHCNPAEFIMAARLGQNFDYTRAAEFILSANPLGETCGLVCPDTLCMAACSRKKFDAPVNIPKIQATLVHKAREKSTLTISKPISINKRIAIIGAGPAGLAAAGVLARLGYKVELLEANSQAGGACRLIPDTRLPKASLNADINYILSLGSITLKTNSLVNSPETYLHNGYDAVIVAEGQPNALSLGVTGDEHAITFNKYLATKQNYANLQQVAVVGGGAVAVDCAVVAAQNGATHVEMMVRRTLADMPLTQAERDLILEYKIDVSTRTRITKLETENNKITLHTVKMGTEKSKLVDLPNTQAIRPNFDLVIYAIGAQKLNNTTEQNGLFFAGDCCHGETTVVEAAASGKNAAYRVAKFLQCNNDAVNTPQQIIEAKGSQSPIKSRTALQNIQTLPVNLACNFLGIPLESPFLLSAAPATDGIEPMRKALKAGWAGGIMKTAFDDLPIHIPNGYMFTFGQNTYGNCDNVSDHSLNRVCFEIKILRAEFPSKLIAGSTGGSLTGDKTADKHSWQSNTQKLEQAGAMLVEYSLSCPQGGDGSDGAIASQNAALSAEIIDWVLEISNPDIPKLFKLSGAVTSIQVIVAAIKKVFDKYPHKKAGITLANSFPALAFRETTTPNAWDEGIVVGLSGKGVVPISYLTLANAASLKVAVSGNGGAMNYRAAANFMALGAQTVQFCTIAMKHGVGIIDELHSGLSHLLHSKGYKSVHDFIGCALPNPITDFMNLTSDKEISDRNPDLCVGCGNCSNCGYQAITLNSNKLPITDASKCIGCSICVKTCFANAMFMRARTPAEKALLVE